MLREDLKKRFRSEYLGQLMARKKKKDSSKNIHVGYIVLVGN